MAVRVPSDARYRDSGRVPAAFGTLVTGGAFPNWSRHDRLGSLPAASPSSWRACLGPCWARVGLVFWSAAAVAVAVSSRAAARSALRWAALDIRFTDGAGDDASVAVVASAGGMAASEMVLLR